MVGVTSVDIGGWIGWMVLGACQVVQVLVGQGLLVYVYCFFYVVDVFVQGGVQYVSDIFFFFDMVVIKYGDQATACDLGMGKAISAYLVNFARRGDPNGYGLLVWFCYVRAGDQLMDFSAGGKVVVIKDFFGFDFDVVVQVYLCDCD